MTQSKNATKNQLFRAIGLLIIALLVGSAYYFFIGKSDTDRPPSLSIGGNRFQGLIGDDIGCRLNGLREFTAADVADYQQPSGIPASQHYTLKRGVHLYHTTEDTTVEEILNYIVPTENNKILIAFYNYGLGGTETGFYLDPEMAENFPIEDADSFTIPAYHGFVLISCHEGEILKIRDEKLAGTGLPDNLDTIDGWVLLAIEDNTALSAAVDGLGAHLKALWVENGPGFNFEKIEDLDSPELIEDYYMAWFKLDSTVIEDDDDDDDDAGIRVIEGDTDADGDDDDDMEIRVIERDTDVLDVGLDDATDEINTEKLNIPDKDSASGSPYAVRKDTDISIDSEEDFSFQRPDSCSDCDTTDISGCRDCDSDGYYIQCLADSDPCGSFPSRGIDTDDRDRNVR